MNTELLAYFNRVRKTGGKGLASDFKEYGNQFYKYPELYVAYCDLIEDLRDTKVRPMQAISEYQEIVDAINEFEGFETR